jgi:hypothetical protein
MKQAAGLTLAGFVGGVSYFLGLGFEIPNGCDGFRFFATFGAIAGFGIGGVFGKRAAGYKIKTLGFTILAVLIVGFAAALLYMLILEVGAAAPGPLLVVELAMLLTVAFLCLGALLPLAGLSFAS